jgi:hypothetical protein
MILDTNHELARSKDLSIELNLILERVRDASRVAQFWGWTTQLDHFERAEGALETWLDEVGHRIGELE